jgi:hypothetical protein
MIKMNKRYIALYFLVSSMANIACAGTDTWIKDAATGCEIWNPCPAEHESIIWKGDIESGKASGYGVAVWKVRDQEMERSEGQWKDGKLDGDAVWTHANGSAYEGQWKGGKKTGCGIYTWRDGTTFLGEYQDDIRSHGRLISPDGTPLNTIESTKTRELVYNAQDAAIQARKSATQARLKHKALKKAAAVAPEEQSAPKPATVVAEVLRTTEEPEEDPSAK